LPKGISVVNPNPLVFAYRWGSLSIVTVSILVKLLKLIPMIQALQELNSHGHYIRKLYLLNGLIIVLALWV